MYGVVVGLVATSEVAREKLQPVDEVIGAVPTLPDDVLDLARFVSTYYQEPLGLVLAQMLPPQAAGKEASSRSRRSALQLTEAGRNALAVSLARAPRARALFEGWLAAPDAILTTAMQDALPGHLRQKVRSWWAAGWAEATSATDNRNAAGDVHSLSEIANLKGDIDANHFIDLDANAIRHELLEARCACGQVIGTDRKCAECIAARVV